MADSGLESSASGIESSDSTADSATNPLKIGWWVWAEMVVLHCHIHGSILIRESLGKLPEESGRTRQPIVLAILCEV